MRVRLKPALRRVWRDDGVLQIGLSPRHGTVLAGVTPEDAALLDALREGVDPAADVPPEARARRAELLTLLETAGVLVRAGRSARSRVGPPARGLTADAAVWSLTRPGGSDGWEVIAARRLRHVAVAGGGRLATLLASTLAACGVGHVTVDAEGRTAPDELSPASGGKSDIGRPRAEAVADAVARMGGRAAPPGPGAAARPDVVVLVDHGAADATRADPLLSRDIPHLSVVVREDEVHVGPLVRPGHGPCLRCLDLHRTERDPAWPTMLAQLHGPGRTPRHEESALSALAAGLASLQVLAQLDGVEWPAARGATLELELPDGLPGRRTWPAHPRCGCHWPPAGDEPDATWTLQALEQPATAGAGADPPGGSSCGRGE